MPRVRIFFSKAGRAAFISHVDMPVIFGRAARRAGLVPEMTEGFTPRPRLALGPPLPVGVIGVCEPADMWLASLPEGAFDRLRASMPEGLELLEMREVDGPSLSKLCTEALYELETVGGADAHAVSACVSALLGGAGALRSIETDGARVRYVSGELERLGPSKVVAGLADAGLISGWKDLLITRHAVGRWDESEGRLVPVSEVVLS